ncbi:MAG: UDP-N-acetylmuramoyl-L-alanyl-D-glutamate--2,6-diaminopimelate ligase [Erysipelothrix sp.]|nr:UDP-N-acetylmuramoyl-L-alanyl-D-glutamate--2,6-diaminopimelate ligase [Erysipelothrix sp.]
MVNNPQTLKTLFNIESSVIINELVTDSRKKSQNSIFFCVQGIANDGHKFIEDAIANGAVCIVHSMPLTNAVEGIHYILVDDVLSELNRVVNIFYKHPSEKLDVFAITGTNGKTSVSRIISDMLNHEVNTGYIGTINIAYNNREITANYTTPEVIDLHHVMNDMVNDNVKALAIEVSSHSIVQRRVEALAYDYAIFTNLTHEHLDYHGTIENYFAAKAQLFEHLNEDQVAIINIDDEYGLKLMDYDIKHKISYAIDKEADYQAINVVYGINDTQFDVLYKGEIYPFVTNLVAKFNVSNLLAAIAALHHYGISMINLQAYAKMIKQISGRVEKISFNDRFQVIVDYAHTPDGFLKLFTYAKDIAKDHRVISVFGSAGERDILKRSILGEIADKYSDMIILTADDPRKENVMDISKQIAEKIRQNYIVIENRYDAIYQAIELANTGDIVLVLGKGNDQYMALQNGKEPYIGDVEIVKEILEEYLDKEQNYE